MLQDIWCIFSKEFGSYFRTRLGYFVMIIYVALAMAMTFYRGGYFELVNDNLFSFFYFQPEIFTFLAPALTMKLWADERRYGTLELLLSQPVSYPSLVMGKFLAAWMFCLLMLSLSLPLWLTTANLQPLDNSHVAFGYLACWLAAGAVCAIGCAVSAFSANPVTAYILSVFVCWILKLSNFDYLIQHAKVSNELLIRMSNALNFDRHFENIISGQLSLANPTYFVLLIALTLWLNAITVNYKRS